MRTNKGVESRLWGTPWHANSIPNTASLSIKTTSDPFAGPPPKSFNGKTGTFVMELVHTATHDAAKHTGAYAKYLDWVADVVRTGQFASVNSEAAAAAKETLKRAELGITRTASLSKSSIRKAITELGKRAATSSSARVFARVLRKTAGKALGAGFILYAGTRAYTQSGSVGEAGRAMGRELVLADVVEVAVNVTAGQLANTLDDVFIHPDQHAAKRFRSAGEDVRMDMVRQVQDAKPDKTFSEIAEEQDVSEAFKKDYEEFQKPRGGSAYWYFRRMYFPWSDEWKWRSK